MRENINEIDKFLMICQTFPYELFLLAIANVPLATDLPIFLCQTKTACGCKKGHCQVK